LKNFILVAGATGNLGGKIVDALLLAGAQVKVIVRNTTNEEKIKVLEAKGVIICKVSRFKKNEIAPFCDNVLCAVSALSGLQDVIITAQKEFVDACIHAKVKRFIPSDFCIDYTNLIAGTNRNLDLRRDFNMYLNTLAIESTSIFNGAFMELLNTEMPLILTKKNKILCWGNPNQTMEFTHTLDIAKYTALVALDTKTPRILRISGDKKNCNDFVKLMNEITGFSYKIFRPGGIALLNFLIKATRFFSPSKNELYPAWQGMQYMRDMMEGRIEISINDSNKYEAIYWTNIKPFLNKHKS
jgi:nucleoside-diphosphate-sugar epimerase